MLHRTRSLLLMLVPLAAVACTSPESTETEPTGESPLQFSTGPFEVPEGDSFECFYTDQHTTTDLAVFGALGTQGPGGHHIVAYWTEVERDPQHHPCEDSEMVNWHQIAGGDLVNGGEPTLILPDGFAIEVPAGKQIVLQAHYINISGAPQTVEDTIELKTIEPEKVEQYVNYFVTFDDKFEVPAQGSSTSTSVCTLDRDYNFVLMLPHMHDWGKSYTLEQLDDAGAPVKSLIDTPVWSAEYASHPPVITYPKESPLFLPKGTKVRQTCAWDNNTADPLLFPREMCLSYSYYFPADGDIICDNVHEEAP